KAPLPVRQKKYTESFDLPSKGALPSGKKCKQSLHGTTSKKKRPFARPANLPLITRKPSNQRLEGFL
ncbi:hypothetical protein LZZ85_26035, partial [Terrimonas sp. NA20]